MLGTTEVADRQLPDARVGGRTSRAQPPVRATIEQRFSPSHNSLNFLRLALASVVLLFHAYRLGAFGVAAFPHGRGSFGGEAVYGFFGVSGFLIASSGARNSLGRYLWQRVLRILPAFWVCLLVTVGFFGVIGWYHTHAHCGLSCYVSSGNGPGEYFVHNSWLRINQHAIAGTPVGVPRPGIWNGSLWSLFYEFLCYLFVGALAATTLLRRRWPVLVTTAALWVAEVVITCVPSLSAQFNVFRNYDALQLLTLLPIFLTGSVIYLYRERIPDSGLLALGCFAVLAVSVFIPVGRNLPELTFTSTDLSAPAVGYLLIWLGIHLPFQRVGARNDYSYGVYIYAYPVTQLLAMWHAYRWGYPAFVVMVVLLTLPFAVASWWLVEKPALRLKRVRFERKRPLAVALLAEPAPALDERLE